MKKINLLLLGAFAFGALTLIPSCTKESDLPPDEQISFDSEEVMAQVPEALKNSTNDYAIQCIQGIESAMDMSSFMDNLVPPEDAVRSLRKSSEGTWQWTVSNIYYTVTFYWTYEEDLQKRTWTMEVQFDGGEIYPYITAWESKDGSEGEILYNFAWTQAYESTEDYEDIYWRYHWTVDNAGNYTFYWNYDSSDDSYAYYLKYEVKVNADGSGSIDYYTTDIKFYHMEWDTLGNGSWTYYYGTEEMSGTWTV